MSIGCKRKNISDAIFIQKSEINISIDDFSLPNYDVFHVTEFEDLFVAYNSKTHALDIFSLSKERFESRIKLEGEGPKAISAIKGLYFHSDDSIFTYSQGKIQLFDKSYSKVINFDLYAFQGENQLNFDPIINQHFRLNFIPELGAIPFFNNYFGGNKSYEEGKSLVSLFYLDGQRFELMPFYHTETISNVDCFGFLNYANLSSVYNAKGLINNQYSGATYLLDFKSGESMQVLKPDKSPKHMESGQDWEKHAVESTFYFSLEKLSEQRYARLLWLPQESNPQENGFLYKKFMLQIFDEGFN